MEYIDYYKILGVSKKASEKEIKEAYRHLARRYHPDLNPNDKEANKKFQQINEANEVLSDPEKRKRYDLYEPKAQQARSYATAQHQTAATDNGRYRYVSPEEEDDFSGFFSFLFGKKGPKRKATGQKGGDYKADLRIGLTEAYFTHQRTINLNGKKIRITIPAGIENGQVIKISGYGAPSGNGAPAGDLYITLIIPDHPLFKRDGNNLLATIELDLYTAVLGGDVTIDTINGKIKLKVKEGTQNGTIIRLKDKGYPLYRQEGSFGDLLITYIIKIPTQLTIQQKELFQKLARLSG